MEMILKFFFFNFLKLKNGVINIKIQVKVRDKNVCENFVLLYVCLMKILEHRKFWKILIGQTWPKFV